MGKILEVDPTSPDEKERQLAATVTVFPQVKAILNRILADQELKKKSRDSADIFLPKWYTTAIILERLLDAGIIEKDSERKCGYRTEYSNIHVNFLKERDRTILAKGASMYAANIEEAVTESDSVENTLFIYYENEYTLEGHQAFFKGLRALDKGLQADSTKSTNDDSVMRISISAKIFPKK